MTEHTPDYNGYDSEANAHEEAAAVCLVVIAGMFITTGIVWVIMKVVAYVI